MLEDELDKPARPPIAEAIGAVARNGGQGQLQTRGPHWHAMLGLGPAPAHTSFDVLDECTQLRHDLVPAWIIKKHAWSQGCERIENPQQLPLGDGSRHDWRRQLPQSYPFNRGTEQGWKVVRYIRSINGDLDGTAIVIERPMSNRAARAAPPETCVITQMSWQFRGRTICQVGRAADGNEPERRGQPHGDHVGCNELTQSNTGIEAPQCEVGKFLAGNDLDLDSGVGSAERGNDRFQQDGHRPSGHGEAQQAARFVREFTGCLAR